MWFVWSFSLLIILPMSLKPCNILLRVWFWKVALEVSARVASSEWKEQEDHQARHVSGNEYSAAGVKQIPSMLSLRIRSKDATR
jgi:hypothetical protein